MGKGYNIGLRMNRTQALLGWLYLPFYLFLTSFCLQQLAKLLHISLSGFQLNVLYFTINTIFVLCVYGRFLLKSFRGFTEHFWKFIQSLILGFALYYFTNFVLVYLQHLIFGSVTSFNNELVESYISENRAVMLVFTVFAVPIAEELLVRGVVFGSVHPKNRILAYVASTLLFSFMHVWQFYGAISIVDLLLNAVLYVPAAVALGWTYEKSGTIWCPIALHCLINAISFGISVLP